MPFNGSGTFSRVYNWVTDRNNGINILASRVDTEDDGFAAGLTNCITKDGQSTPTADIGLGGYKLKNVGVATLANDAVTAGQLQGNGLLYYADTGAADAYVITPNPAVSSYAAGQSWLVKIANANLTTTPTINVNGLGAKTIKNRDGTALVAGALAVGSLIRFDYDGTSMQVTPATIAGYNPASVTITGGTINGTTVGAVTPSSGAFTTLSASSTLGVTGTSTLGVVNSGLTTITNTSAGALTPGIKLVNSSNTANTSIQIELQPSTTSGQSYKAVALNDGSNNISLGFYSSIAGSGTKRVEFPFAGGMTVGSATTGTPTDGQVNATGYLINGTPFTATYALLSTQTASNSATLDFTSVITSSYDYYVFILQDLRPASTGVDLWMRTSSNNSTFDTTSSYAYYSDGMSFSAAVTAAGTTSDNFIKMNNVVTSNNAATDGFGGKVELFAPNGTTQNKYIQFNIEVKSSGLGNGSFIRGHAMRGATTVVNAARFMMSSGVIVSGKIYCYGVKNT